MSDAWSDIQALKSKQSSLRDKLKRRKMERENLIAGITGATPATATTSAATPGTTANADSSSSLSTAKSTTTAPSTSSVKTSSSSSSKSVAAVAKGTKQKQAPVQSIPEKITKKVDPDILEKQLLISLCDIGLNFPADSSVLCLSLTKTLDQDVDLNAVEDLLQKFAAQQLISISKKEGDTSKQKSNYAVESADLAKLSAVAGLNEEDSVDGQPDSKKRKRDDSEGDKKAGVASIESLLSMQSAKERKTKEMNEEILELLSTPTAKEQSIVEKFRSQGGAQVKEFCQYGTKEECYKMNEKHNECKKLHFKKIINKHTDESLGDCSFLNTCFHMETCKYVHYEIDYPEGYKTDKSIAIPKTMGDITMVPPQWVCCDVREFDVTTLGKCSVVMADPPWDIHMELPYGTMSDDEMRALKVPTLQDEGFIFLWVTGRAMELGRECLTLWGYERVDELIWVKTNQLQRIIRTGRTGHWLNHGKEHCLVGVKGSPKQVNKGMDCDVLVAEVRATSHKPDEIYGIIERLSPGTRKIELFGRPHNVQPNWITLGNQLDGVRLVEQDIVKRYKKRYPEGYKMGVTK